MSEADSGTMGIGAIQTGQCAVKLVAVPPSEPEDQLRLRVSKGERIEIDVAITARRIDYLDFSHNEPGQDIVMPLCGGQD
jgi:hypothetical protein